MTPSKSVKPYTPHPTPHTPHPAPRKNFLPQTLINPTLLRILTLHSIGSRNTITLKTKIP
ncbi:hypothetical protein ED562_19380 [Microcystis aeruginosa FACHB-524]|nr:hypothetical protein ED562_19380 [Microcystis aeruginosa FACHB-524]